MGRGFVEYRMPGFDRREAVYWSALVEYRLLDGSTLHIIQQSAWCPECNRFVIAEEIPSIDQLKEELAKYQARDMEQLQKWEFISNGAPVQERIDDLLKRIVWRQTRQSPPRCLECGSIKTISVPTNGMFTHPKTGEQVIVCDQGFADTETWQAEFSPEGNLLSGL